MPILEADLSAIPAVVVLQSLLGAGVDATILVDGTDGGITVSGGRFIVPAGEGERLEALVLAVLSAHEGRLVASRAAVVEGEPHAIDLVALAQRARESDLAGVRRAIPVVAVDVDAENVQLSGSELRLMLRIDGQRTVDEITGGDVGAIEGIRALVDRGYLTLSAEAGHPDVSDPAAGPGETFPGIAALTMEDEARTTHLLEEPTYLIGRTVTGIQIDHPSVSGTHARLQRAPEGYVLEDAGSRNGSFVNGEKIESQLLHDGDRIRLGTVYLTYSIARTDEPTGVAT